MPEPAARLVRVLLIEDNPDDANLLCEELAEADGVEGLPVRYEVDQADRLSTAAERLRHGPYDVVVLDLSLPDSLGLDTYDRARDLAPDLPIVVLSGADDQALAVQAVRQGAQDYLWKGRVTADVLARVLCYAVERSHAERDRAELRREQGRRAMAEATIRARDEFVSIASHELWTPVTGIKGHAQLLRRQLERGSVDPARLRRSLAMIEEQSDRIHVLTRDLLDLSRIRLGRLPLLRRPIDLGTLVRDVAARHRGRLGERHRLVIDVGKAPQPVLGDPQRIEQVLIDLVQNAVRYSPDGGRIHLTLRDHDGEVLLRVRDQGIGLPAEALETIFEPFGRGSNATREHIAGLGLGLFICRSLVEAQGGRIWAESEGEGKGASFVVCLPRYTPPTRPSSDSAEDRPAEDRTAATSAGRSPVD